MHSWRNVALAIAFLGSGHPRSAMAQATSANCWPGVCSGRVRAVSIKPDSMKMARNTGTMFKASVAADANVTNRKVLWSSTDSRIASVDAEGWVVAYDFGTARIVATAAADRNMKASAVVTVFDGGLASIGPIRRPTTPANRDDIVYFEFQVQKQVRVLPGAPREHYPNALRAANVEGSVLLQFVVDAKGMVDTTTIKVLKSTHDSFSLSARATLRRTHFTPAEVGGRRVKQLVQMPFQFSLKRTPPPTR